LECGKMERRERRGYGKREIGNLGGATMSLQEVLISFLNYF